MSTLDRVAAALAALALVLAGHVHAGGIVAGATEPTQIMNNLQLVKVGLDSAKTATTVVGQYATQIQQYEAQLVNMMKLPKLPDGLADVAKTASDLIRYKSALEALSGSLLQQQTAIERRLTEARLGGMDWKTYLASVSDDAAKKGQRSVERLKYEQSVLEQVQSDYAFARDLQQQIPATVGQHQALQLMNAQMNRIVTQNAKLLEVMSASVHERAEREANEAEAALHSNRERDLVRQRQEEIEERLRAFGGFQ